MLPYLGYGPFYGLHLVSFDPRSIIPSRDAIEEINRLRKMYRNDLPLYSIPHEKPIRCKLVGHIQDADLNDEQPGRASKRRKVLMKPSPKRVKPDRKRSGSTIPQCTKPAKKVCSSKPPIPEQEEVGLPLPNNDQAESDCCIITSCEPCMQPYSYYPVDVVWQRNACTTLGLQYCRSSRLTAGGPHVPLTPPDPCRIKTITADGNCLFRSLSYIITGSQEQHMHLRRVILDHMVHIAHFLLGHLMHPHYLSIQEYIQDTRMNEPTSWGTEIEIWTLAHLLGTCIFTYNTEHESWYRYSPHDVDRTLRDNVTQMALYIRHPPIHFDVVCGIMSPSHHCPQAHVVQ